MKIKDYKCKCGHDDFFFAKKGNNMGIYCSYCGKWAKWADKDERNLTMKQEQKTGKWQKYEGRFDYNWECSECGCSAWEKTDYCAYCGARMED